MGIYDRDYYRREGPSFLGSLVERGTICKWLVGINVVVFLCQLATRAVGDQVTSAFILDRDAVLHGELWRLLTYAFLHGSLGHIFWNMLFLYWFGRDIEDLYGPREFLIFYLAAALLGGLVFLVVPEEFTNILRPNGPLVGQCLGASGAVTAVMVLFACRYPTRVILLFLVLPVPIWAFVAFAVAKDLFSFLSGGGEGTAVQVHLAGAALAFGYYRFHWRFSNWLPDVQRWRQRQTAPRLRVYRPEGEEEERKPVPAGGPPPAVDEDQLEAKMDAVLEKISRTGKDSLTESERAVLLRASEVFRRRRH